MPFADTATGYLSPFAGSDTKPFNDADTGVPLSASYHDLLDGCFYNGFAGTPTVTIGGLTVGQQYLIQLWANFCPTTQALPGFVELIDGTQIQVNSNNGKGLGQDIPAPSPPMRRPKAL